MTPSHVQRVQQAMKASPVPACWDLVEKNTLGHVGGYGQEQIIEVVYRGHLRLEIKVVALGDENVTYQLADYRKSFEPVIRALFQIPEKKNEAHPPRKRRVRGATPAS